MGYYDYYSSYPSYYDYYDYGYATETATATGLGAILGAFLGIILVIGLVVAIIQLAGMWKVFTKAGEKGWKAIIPFYNMAILYKISGMSPYLVFVYLGLLIPIVNFFVAAAIGIISLYQVINLSKGFNKSTGFTVAIIVVPFIAYLMLGFGDSKYVGFDNKEA